MTKATPPRRILLATDLSCRCDRALDRAVQLTDVWNAELIAATIIEPDPADLLDQRPVTWRRQSTPVERMRWRLSRDVASASDNIHVLVEKGDPAATLIEIAQREKCELVITGIARDETFGRMILGNTVTRLVRGAEIPVLVVRDRPLSAYRKIVVATDFSETSLQAMLVAGAFFPEAALALFHGQDVPTAGGLARGATARDTQILDSERARKFLADSRVGAALREKLDVVVEQGAPETLLSHYVEDRHVDLTVVGSQGHGVLFDAFIGSMDKRLLDTLEGDLLIVRQVKEG